MDQPMPFHTPGSLFGGSFHQSCAGLVRDPTSDPQTTGWGVRLFDTSSSDPAKGVHAGDYLGAVTARPGSNAWAGTCVTLRGGGRDDSNEDDAEIHYAIFGRRPSEKP